ncbi:MAG TPA: SIS domain-containing protein [Gammaproteobacteria bacterium]|nr:SIS domain-containing protein [Gammaproteobacteria bacterium]
MKSPQDFFKNYGDRLSQVLATTDWSPVYKLALDLKQCWMDKKQVFICGNGGSAGNAIHLANDYLYGIAKSSGTGIKVHALSANPAVITCFGNDIGYEKIFSEQLAVLAEKDDLLIVLSGSGNSSNIIEVLEEAKRKKIKSYAILGFSGGRCKSLADVAIHFPIDDMQIAEDLQLVVGHVLMQWLFENHSKKLNKEKKELTNA